MVIIYLIPSLLSTIILSFQYFSTLHAYLALHDHLVLANFPPYTIIKPYAFI